MGSDYFMEASNRHAVGVNRFFGGSSRTPRPRERDIESAAVRWARAHGWLAIKVGTDGWPDRLFVRPEVSDLVGVFVIPGSAKYKWVEFKRPGGKVTPLQARRHAQLREQGAEVHVCYSTAEVREVLGE